MDELNCDEMYKFMRGIDLLSSRVARGSLIGVVSKLVAAHNTSETVVLSESVSLSLFVFSWGLESDDTTYRRN